MKSPGLNLFHLIHNILEKLKFSFHHHFSYFPFILSPYLLLFDEKKKIKHMLTVKGYRINATLLPLIEVREFSKGKYLYQAGICVTGISWLGKGFLIYCCLHLGSSVKKKVSLFSIHRESSSALFSIQEVKHHRKNKTSNSTFVLWETLIYKLWIIFIHNHIK